MTTTNATKHGSPTLYATSGSITGGANSTLYAAMMTATDSAGDLIIYNSSGSAVTPTLRIKAPANDSKLIDFSYLGGVPFPTGMYLTVTNGSAVLWRE